MNKKILVKSRKEQVILQDAFLLYSNYLPLQLRKSSKKEWTLCQKCPFSSAKTWHFERPNLRTDSKKLAKHPPKWFIRHLVHGFSIFGRVSSQFLKITFLEAIWRRFTLFKGKKLETGGQVRKMPQKSFFLQKWVAYI